MIATARMLGSDISCKLLAMKSLYSCVQLSDSPGRGCLSDADLGAGAGGVGALEGLDDGGGGRVVAEAVVGVLARRHQPVPLAPRQRRQPTFTTGYQGRGQGEAGLRGQ